MRKRLTLLIAVASLFALPSYAQTPQKVVPGYQSCSNASDTVTGVITGTLSRALWVPANTAGLGVDEQIYSPCVPASAPNTAIAVVSGAPGTGGVVTVNATGYQL
jgi:hypothetical protein